MLGGREAPKKKSRDIKAKDEPNTLKFTQGKAEYSVPPSAAGKEEEVLRGLGEWR